MGALLSHGPRELDVRVRSEVVSDFVSSLEHFSGELADATVEYDDGEDSDSDVEVECLVDLDMADDDVQVAGVAVALGDIRSMHQRDSERPFGKDTAQARREAFEMRCEAVERRAAQLRQQAEEEKERDSWIQEECQEDDESSEVDQLIEDALLTADDAVKKGGAAAERPLSATSTDIDKLIAEEEAAEKPLSEVGSEVERLIAEEAAERPASEVSSEVEQLVAEEIAHSTPSKKAMWVSGSPAAAARRMRRSAPSLFQMDGDDSADEGPRDSSLTRGYKALGAQVYSLEARDIKDTGLATWNYAKPRNLGNAGSRSAMALDLDLAAGSSRSSQGSARSARSSSATAVKLSKSKHPVAPLGPLVLSKSTGMLPTLSARSAGHDPCAWSVGPLGTVSMQRKGNGHAYF